MGVVGDIETRSPRLEAQLAPASPMASPDGLRLYLGKHALPDVLDLIFQYGFHLWLAKPHNAQRSVMRVVHHDGPLRIVWLRQPQMEAVLEDDVEHLRRQALAEVQAQAVGRRHCLGGLAGAS